MIMGLLFSFFSFLFPFFPFFSLVGKKDIPTLNSLYYFHMSLTFQKLLKLPNENENAVNQSSLNIKTTPYFFPLKTRFTNSKDGTSFYFKILHNKSYCKIYSATRRES